MGSPDFMLEPCRDCDGDSPVHHRQCRRCGGSGIEPEAESATSADAEEHTRELAEESRAEARRDEV